MNILVLFTYGISLKTWKNQGLIQRELKLYKRLLTLNPNLKFTFITCGRINSFFFSNFDNKTTLSFFLSDFFSKITTTTFVYINILCTLMCLYLSISVCVCVCVCVPISNQMSFVVVVGGGCSACG